MIVTDRQDNLCGVTMEAESGLNPLHCGAIPQVDIAFCSGEVWIVFVNEKTMFGMDRVLAVQHALNVFRLIVPRTGIPGLNEQFGGLDGEVHLSLSFEWGAFAFIRFEKSGGSEQ